MELKHLTKTVFQVVSLSGIAVNSMVTFRDEANPDTWLFATEIQRAL